MLSIVIDRKLLIVLSNTIINTAKTDIYICSQKDMNYLIMFRDCLIYFAMRIISKRTLRAFWIRHPDAEDSLLAWYREVEKAEWEGPADVKEKYRSASFVKGNRVIFNIKGNDYRLIVKINYGYRVVYVRFVGKHAEYDKIDAKEV